MSRTDDPRFRRQGALVEIAFDGEPVQAIEGETIAAALTAAGRRTLGHDRDGNPRGLFCGMGVCFECLVSIDGRAGERACLVKVAPGMRVRSLDYRVALEAPSRPAPERGTLAGEHRGNERGEGEGERSDSEPAPARRCDLLVLGAGPAGLAAAETAARHGLAVIVVDERPEPGGQYFKPLAPSQAFSAGRPTDEQYAEGRALLERVRASGAELVSGATAWSARRTDTGEITLALANSGHPTPGCNSGHPRPGNSGHPRPDSSGHTADFPTHSEGSGREVAESPGHPGNSGHPELASSGCPEADRQKLGCPELVTARQLVVASGAYERAVPFPGWTLPGVVTTGAAQSLLRSYRVAVGERVLVAGNGPLNFQVASELAAAGVQVVAVAETAPAPLTRRAGAALRALWHDPALVRAGLRYRRALRAGGVPILHGHRIAAAEGDGRVSRALLEPVDGAGARRAFDVDAVCVGYGFLPSNEIPRLLGCEFDVFGPGHLVPLRDGEGRTTVPNVFVIGDGGAFGGARVAMAEGRLAAAAALRACGLDVAHDAPAQCTLTRHRRFQRALWALFAAPDPGLELAADDTLACRCESVTLGRARELVRGGSGDLRALKCATRAGMGRCQGRYCTAILARLLERETGAPPDARALFAPQIPAKPLPVDALAAEQPEWSGYRPAPVDSPGRTSASADAPGETDTDVLVIGAGVVGISAAYYLARAGVATVLVDRGAPNGQASGGNAGSLHLQLLSFDAAAGATEAGAPALRTLALQAEGIGLWRSLADELGADLELQITGGLMVAENTDDLAFLERKTAAERGAGIEAELIGAAELRDLAPAVSTAMAGAAYCPGEGKINPLAATPAILAAACEAGLATRFGAAVTGIERRADGFRVATDAGAIRCRRIVNAAGGWSRAIAALAGLDLPVLSAPQQMIVTEPAAPLVGHLLAHAHRHLTMKQAKSGNLIIGGGWFAGFDQALARPVTLQESIAGNLWAARRVVPAVAGLNVIRTWAAVGVSIDGAPILGEAPGHPGFYNAVGANGYTMGPVMGRITAELIAKGRAKTDLDGFTLERF